MGNSEGMRTKSSLGFKSVTGTSLLDHYTVYRIIILHFEAYDSIACTSIE